MIRCKQSFRLFPIIFCAALLLGAFFPSLAFAKEGDLVLSDLTVVSSSTKVSASDVLATVDSQGRWALKVDGTSNDVARLRTLVAGDSSKSIVIPSGTTLQVSSPIRLGNNTKLDATGATIVATTDGKGIISHYVDGINYSALTNVIITGGTWKGVLNADVNAATIMRFAHASNVTIKDASIICNVESHAIELIACADCTVSGCTINGTYGSATHADSNEEAIQIDIATPATAPGVLKETGNAYMVAGQTCKNITVTGCTINSGRGVCANFAKTNTEYMQNCHTGIRITNNNITGNTAEPLVLYNSLNSYVTGNTIVTNTPLSRDSYSDGLAIRLKGKCTAARKAFVYVAKNTVQGGRWGINITSDEKNVYYKSLTYKNNKTSAKAGSSKGIHISKDNNRAVMYLANLKAPTVKKVSSSGSALKVKWKKVSGATGYQVRATAKSGSAKTTVSAGKSTLSKTLKLKKKKAYYVQVRAKKKLGGCVLYSSWSTKKAAKTK